MKGLRSLVIHLPITRFAEFIIGRRLVPTRWQIDLSPLEGFAQRCRRGFRGR